MPADLIERLRQHKPELLAMLSVRERRGRFRAAHPGRPGGDRAGSPDERLGDDPATADL